MGLSVKIKNVHVIGEMLIQVEFENSRVKTYDINKLVDEFPIYGALKNRSFLNLVKVDCGGYGISWSDEIDISECELWENGI